MGRTEGVGFLAGEGELGDLIASNDWSRSGLGPIELWPRSLKSYISMILRLPTPAIVFWGPDLIQIYNKGYAAIMGPRHPQYLGSRYRDCWPETYATLSPWFQRVQKGEVMETTNTLFTLTRHGYPEETYFTFSFSPLRGDHDEIAGVLQPVTEVTDVVLSERRLSTIRSLTRCGQTLSATSPQGLIDTLADNSKDVPFALLYVWDESRGSLVLTASCGLTEESEALLRAKNSNDVLLAIFNGTRAFELCQAEAILAQPHIGPWGEPTMKAGVYSLQTTRLSACQGLLILGISPRLPFNEVYQAFLGEIAGTIAASFEQRGLASQYEMIAAEEKAVSQALVLSEQRHYTTLKSIGDGVITTTTDAVPRIDFMNAVAEELTGWSLEDAKGRPVRQVFNTILEDTRQQAENPVERALQHKGAVERSHHQVLISQGGDEYIIEDSASLIKGDNGAINGVVLVFRDVTEKRRLEKETRDHQRQLEIERGRLQNLFNQAPLPICMLQGPEHVFVLANPSYTEQLVGRRRVIGKSVREALPEVIDQGFNDLLDSVYQSGQAFHGTEVAVRLLKNEHNDETDTYYLNFVYQPTIDQSGSVDGILVIATDVTQQVLARRAIEESEARYRSLADSLPQIVWSADPSGVLNYTSEQWTIYSGSNVPGDWFSFVHPDDAKQVAESWLHAITSGDDYDVEFRLRRADATYRWHLVRAKPYRDSADKIVRWDGTCTDIDEQRNLAEELHAAKVQAENATRAKSAFLANMSHEIRTPLGIILGFSEFLLDTNQTPADRLDCILTLRRNATQLAGLINELLDLSKIEADRLEIEKVGFDLQELIEDVHQLMDFKAREKGIELKFLAMAPVPRTVETDPTRLRQILINVIDNAIKFTPRGSVDVHVGMSFPRKGDESALLNFIVSDTGIGLSSQEHDKIWEPFVQGDSSTTRRFGGTGLGLSLSRRLARALGGDLRLERSEVGKGTTFVASLAIGAVDSEGLLPIAYTFQEPAVGAPKEEPAPGVLKGAQVLLVEDSPDNQRLATRILQMAGADVELACDGEEGCRKALAGDYHVVLMDVQMPKIDGYEATALLRAQGYGKPIIALTAHAMKGEREKALHAGFDDYLAKPIDRRALTDKIAHFLELHDARSAWEIDDILNDPDFREVIADFQNKNLPLLIAGLHEAFQQGDHKRLAEIGHRLRGSVAHYFAPQVNEIGGMIEDEAKGQSRRSVIEPLIGHLVNNTPYKTIEPQL